MKGELFEEDINWRISMYILEYFTKARNKRNCSKWTRVGTIYNGKSLGVFKSLNEAIEKQEEIKRIHIRNVADEYKDRISEKVYNALYNW